MLERSYEVNGIPVRSFWWHLLHWGVWSPAAFEVIKTTKSRKFSASQFESQCEGEAACEHDMRTWLKVLNSGKWHFFVVNMSLKVYNSAALVMYLCLWNVTLVDLEHVVSYPLVVQLCLRWRVLVNAVCIGGNASSRTNQTLPNRRVNLLKQRCWTAAATLYQTRLRQQTQSHIGNNTTLRQKKQFG